MKVLLKPGVWIADYTKGDPPRTIVEEYAQEFTTTEEAQAALSKAREHRPFEDAVIKGE